MPPKKGSKGKPMQGGQSLDPAVMLKRMEQSKNKRKMEKRNQLEAGFTRGMEEAEQKVEQLLEGMTSESIAMRSDVALRLMGLFKKRGDIESQIIEHSRLLEQAYSATNNELRTILRGKLGDIDHGPTDQLRDNERDANDN